MLVFVDFEHASAHERKHGERILAARTRLTYRLEDLAGMHCHLVRYDRIDQHLLDTLGATAIFVSGNSVSPHDYDADSGVLRTALLVGRQAVDVRLRATAAGRLAVDCDSRTALTPRARTELRRQLRHMLRLDDDLSAFHAACADEPRLRWAARRGAGHLLRSTSTFEDLMKLLFTTNTTWAGTKAMTQKLVDALGTAAPSGRRAFPAATACVRPATFYRDTVRAGYRAEAATALARAFANGELTDTTFLQLQSSDELRTRLLVLRGFGPYAVGQAMRLFGHFEELALDSWCRARLAELDGRSRPPTDRAVARRYARFAPYQGLALWLDLTAAWHGEGPR